MATAKAIPLRLNFVDVVCDDSLKHLYAWSQKYDQKLYGRYCQYWILFVSEDPPILQILCSVLLS